MAPGFSSEIQTKATKDPGNDIKNILSLEPSSCRYLQKIGYWQQLVRRLVMNILAGMKLIVA